MFDTFKDRAKRRKLENQLELKQLEFENKQFDSAIKVLSEARNEVADKDVEDGWAALGRGISTTMTQEEHSVMLLSAYNLYHTNTYARAIISNLVKFTLGKGPIIIPEDENVKVKEVWKKFREDNKFNLREKEIGVRTFRDGEVFLREFKSEKTNEEPLYKIRFIRAHHIATPTTKSSTDENTSYGIKTDPDDIEEVIEYYLVDDNKNYISTIPADQIIHFKIISDFDQKRGISILAVVAKRIKQYDEWLEDRIYLNKIRTAIALVRKVKGSAAQVKGIRDDGLSDRLSNDRKSQKAPKRGTIITASQGMEYEMLSPNINATDVKDDGRAILLGIAAAVGFPEMILTADYANANYSSTLIAQNPFVRGIEDWQDQFSSLYMDLFKRVIEYNIEHGSLPVDTKTTCRVEFPPMISADLKQLAEAFEIIYKYKVVSKKTWQSRMGLDSDIEDANMEEEEQNFMDENPIALQPNQFPGQQQPNQIPGQVNPSSRFNLPAVPMNQYASNDMLMNYIDNGDWKSFKEEVEKIGGISEEVSKKLIDTMEIMLFENKYVN